jgi:predicted metal-dependent phosphoesterase TrpH
MGGVRLDLHVHSQHSPDSLLTLEAIASRLTSVGLNGFALTDHNTVDGHEELSSLRARFPDLVLVPGVEISTREGHLLAYGVSIAPPSQRPVAETVEWVRDRGGVCVLSHPFRFSHGVGRAVAESACVTAIETVNGHNSPGANRKAADVAARRRLGGTGGSDAHAPVDLGRAHTEFPEGTKTVGEVLGAMRDGRMTAAGRSLTTAGRIRYEWRIAVLRLRRGFRPI